MDDSCAVCAETLQWVAYGPCGHREVCSTCVARLRFICNDRRCCICKDESDVVFVTKALGDYTRMINDFSVFPIQLREGQVRSYWYHEDTQALFDDQDHYKMVKAMCRLSCSVCDKVDEQSNDGSKKKAKFRNIEQLKGHLFHRHKLLMCSLCLEGRKVFICEQKLYTKAQLKQHISTGDSEVDGSEIDRGGFAGHPMCEFCRTPFYGDNELYTHMSTEHYTCHICQRQHPGQYDYYKNYDDLEIHFRREHFLCEDEACLVKKFVVFQSEAEMKRHNAKEHGGHMSRSQRNAALQIPTSFRYERSSEQNHRRGRGRSFHREASENQLSMAIEASLEMANLASSFHDPSSSSAQVSSDRGNIDEVNPIIQQFNSVSTTGFDPQPRYLQATSRSRNVPLEQSAFPPLPVTPSLNQQNQAGSLPINSMADRLRQPSSSSSSGFPNLPAKKKNNHEDFPSLGASVQAKPLMNSGPSPSGYSSSTHAWPAIGQGPVLAGSLNSSRISKGTKKITHSASAPNLVESMSVDSFTSQFPPIAATQMNKTSTISSQPSLNVQDFQSANKSLVEKMRAALDFDEEKYNTFKEISRQYRQGLIHTVEYLDYVQQFGLSHLVLDLARLCPDSLKQRELLDTYNENMRGNDSLQYGSKKGKGKRSDANSTNLKSSLANDIIASVRELQSSYTPSDVPVEEFSKDGYRSSIVKGKSLVIHEQEQAALSSSNQTKVMAKDTNDYQSDGGSIQNTGNGGGSKQQKKTSKFHRIRLGDGSAEAYLNARKYHSDPDPEFPENPSNGVQNPVEGLPVRGVWRSGGGQKLIGTASRDLRK